MPCTYFAVPGVSTARARGSNSVVLRVRGPAFSGRRYLGGVLGIWTAVLVHLVR